MRELTVAASEVHGENANEGIQGKAFSFLRISAEMPLTCFLPSVPVAPVPCRKSTSGTSSTTRTGGEGELRADRTGED